MKTKKQRNLSIIVALFVLAAFDCIGQPSNFAKDYLPTSPNASSLITFAETPVSHSQGTVNINIPIYTLKSEKLSVPISLSYSSRGIKTVQDASVVGLGWALNAGGVISRSVLGREDEFPGLGYQNNNFDPNDQSDIDNAIELNWDVKPDMYSYNFLGRTGQFVLDVDGNTILEEETDLIITIENDVWTIIDEIGTIYNFAFTEGGTFEGCNMNIDIIDANSWYLTDITSHDFSDNISIFYENYGYTALPSGIDQTFFDNGISGSCCSGAGGFNPCSTLAEVENVVIKKIEGTKFKAVFNNGSREDLANARKIESIEILDINSDIKLKSFDFDYDYYDNFFEKRLKLLQVQEKSGSNIESIPPYTFTYEQTNLKKKTGFGVDHWGFQKNEGTTLLPDIGYVFSSGQTFGNQNREPDEYSLSGILERIDYPTGWFEEFEYEMNGYGKIVNTPVTQAASLQEAIVTCDDTPYCNSPASFTIDAEFPGILIFIDPQGSCGFGPGDCAGFVNIVDSSNNVIWGSPIDTPINLPMDLSPGTYTIEVDNTLDPDVTGDYIVYYYTSNTNPIIERLCGGARIKSIENPDGIKAYSYHVNGLSSGVLLDDIKYSYSATKHVDCDGILCGTLCQGTLYSSSKINSSHSPNHIYYAHVEETLPDNSKVIYKYDYSINISNGLTFPYVPTTSRSALRGQLLERSSYAFDGPSDYRLVERITNEYTHSELNSIPGYSVGSLNTSCLNGEINTYSHKSFWKRKISETQTIFDSSTGQDSVETSKYFSYDPLENHIQIVSDSLVNSDNT